MYKYVIMTITGTIGASEIVRIFYAGDKTNITGTFAKDIYRALLFHTAAEATAVMDVLTKKYTDKLFMVDMVEITLTLM